MQSTVNPSVAVLRPQTAQPLRPSLVGSNKSSCNTVHQNQTGCPMSWTISNLLRLTSLSLHSALFFSHNRAFLSSTQLFRTHSQPPPPAPSCPHKSDVSSRKYVSWLSDRQLQNGSSELRYHVNSNVVLHYSYSYGPTVPFFIFRN